MNRTFSKKTVMLLAGMIISMFLVVTCASQDQADDGGTQQSQMQAQNESSTDGSQGTATQQQMQQQLQQMQAPVDIEVSDEELATFSSAAQTLQTIYQEAQPEMIEAVEANDMTAQRFQAIANSQQNPQSDLEVSEEEMQNFNSALEEIRVIQSEVVQEQMAAVEDEGMSTERFQEILSAVQQDPELQQRLQSMQ